MMDRTERQREHFNTIAERYREARRGRNHQLLKNLIWRELLAGKAELQRPGLAVLEAMCGFADGKKILESQLGMPVKYAGFDFSDEVVTTMHKTSPDLNIWQENVELFRSDPTYDAVLVIGGLHHVPHAAADVVERLTHALRPGGFFLSLEPTSGNPLFTWIRERIYERNTLFDQETEKAFPVQDLHAMFTRAGLSPVDVTYPGLLAYVLYYNPDAFPWLNVGGARAVRTIFALDRLFIRSWLGKVLSFATLSLWSKDAGSA